MPISEADLAAAMLAGRRGDRASYAEALRGIAQLVRLRLARRFRWEADVVEDVVQEVLLSVHLKRATWDGSSPLRPWVNAIADHKAVDFIRKRARDGRLVATSVTLEEVAEIVPAPEHTSDRARPRTVPRRFAVAGA